MLRFLATLFILALVATALADFREFKTVPVDAELGVKLTRAAEASLKDFPRVTADNVALSIIHLTKPESPVRADYHGDASFYPASLVKLFFMVETYHQGKLTHEIERALREMIEVSDNDAAAFLLDILTDTCSGSELEGKALEEFIDRRRKLNRYFASLGYDISAMIKPWSFGPFGRDMQIMGEKQSEPEPRQRELVRLTLPLDRPPPRHLPPGVRRHDVVTRTPSFPAASHREPGERIFRRIPPTWRQTLVQGRRHQRSPPRRRLHRAPQRQKAGRCHPHPRRG